MNKPFLTLIISILLISCGEKKPELKPEIVKEKIIKQFGFTNP